MKNILNPYIRHVEIFSYYELTKPTIRTKD